MANAGCVKAVRFVRRLRGGSQPVLVAASDGFLYVVKRLDNPQGRNLLFNEAIGAAVFENAGLPVPAWAFVEISDTFLDENRDSWFEMGSDLRRPSAGWAFGSRFLQSQPLYDILPQSYFSRIENRADFWTAWVLDVLCEHADARQAIFLEREDRRLNAFFVDHGHLFGGADGVSCAGLKGSQYLDRNIYPGLDRHYANVIHRHLCHIDTAALARTAAALPESWRTETAMWRLKRFCQRIVHPSLLKQTVRLVLGQAEQVERKSVKLAGPAWTAMQYPGLYAENAIDRYA